MKDWQYAVGVLVVLTALAFLSRTANTAVSGTNDVTRKMIKSLVKQSHHYSTIAAQNTNALLQLLYMTKAVAAAKLARKLAPENEVTKICGEDISEWIDDLQHAESKRLTYLGSRYPELQAGSGIVI